MDKIMDFLSIAAKELGGLQIGPPGLTLVIGFLNCFMGYRLLKVWASLTGFTVGALAGYGFVSQYTRNSLAQICAVLLVGLLLGAGAFYLYRAGVFLLCANVAIVAASVLLQPKDSLKFMLCLGIGIAAGILAAAFVKPFVIIHTALGGGFALAVSGTEIFQIKADEKTMFIGIGLFLTGIMVQSMTAPKN